MIYLLIFVYMLAFPIIMITLLWRILDKLEDQEKMQETAQNKIQRKFHPSVGKINYSSPLVGRQSILAYDKYKNNEGLYEPVMPNNGIPIQKKEE